MGKFNVKYHIDGTKVKQGSSNKDRLVFKTAKAAKKATGLIWDLKHPLQVDKRKLAKIDLETVEKEMWLP